jgi:hypothetical protein
LITPNKVITLRESALGRTPIILREKASQANLVSLYDKVGKEFESIDQFLLAIDVLYLLGQIDVDLSTGVVTYAD